MKRREIEEGVTGFIEKLELIVSFVAILLVVYAVDRTRSSRLLISRYPAIEPDREGCRVTLGGERVTTAAVSLLRQAVGLLLHPTRIR